MAFLAARSLAGDAAGGDAAGIDYFERKVRPLLAARCLECHAGAKPKGGLRLDSRAGWAKGGKSGPAVVPGEPEASLLVRAVRWDDPDLRMPPEKKLRLAPAEIAVLERWVALGAPDPRIADAPRRAAPPDPSDHWAYRAPRRSAPPAVRDAAWPLSDIDRHVLAGLEARGLRPSADADRSALARRLYFDLLGLPPSPGEIDAFLADRAPGAFERLADRLLASPRFGEHWARHWFDVARYAQSVSLRGLIFKEAWRYRDYVIDCFNDDVPFDRFIREQIAGDLIPGGDAAERRRRLIATGFLAMGDWNLEEQDKEQLEMDVVDEQLDTIGQAFLAQTIGCARCHDHKFDPIPTRDYYALAGILRSTQTLIHANVSGWIEAPLPLDPEAEELHRRREAAAAALEGELKAARESLAALAGADVDAAAGAAPAVIAPGDLPGFVVDSAAARRVGEWKNSQYTRSYIGDGYLHDDDSGKGEKTLTFHPQLRLPGRYEVRFAYTAGGNRAADVPVTVFHAGGETAVRIDQRRPPPIGGRFVSLGVFRFETAEFAHVLVSNEGTRGHVIADAVQFLPEGESGGRAGAAARDSGTPPGAAGAAADRAARVKELERELQELRESGPRRPMALAVREAETIEDSPIHLRGSVHSLGETVPRGFLSAAAIGDPPPIPAGESGRRELAEWIASPGNPLTARVIANRVWLWLIGDGIVRTPDNFGAAGDRPSHPELLDYLALRLVDEGWSIKKLIREIIRSRVYGLANGAGDDESTAGVDPENRLLGRARRRRLTAECIRDAILRVSGTVDLGAGGPNLPSDLAAEYGFRFKGTRRSVYLPALRTSRPEILEVFDAPSPSTVSGLRSASTAATQALLLLNDPFVREQARAAARRVLARPAIDDGARLERAYRAALGRPPSAAERALALDHLAAAGADPLEAWSDVFQALFACIDFRYLK